MEMAEASTSQPVKRDIKDVLKILKFKKITSTDNCDVGTSSHSNNHAVENDAIPMDSGIFPPTIMGPATPSVSAQKSPRKLQEDDVDQSLRKRRKVESTPQTPATRKYKRLPAEGWFLLDSETTPSSLDWKPRGTPRQWTSSREELYAAVSSLKTTVNGISMTKTTEIIAVVDEDSGIELSNEGDPLVWKFKIKRGYVGRVVATLPTIPDAVPSLSHMTAALGTPNVLFAPSPLRHFSGPGPITPGELSSGSQGSLSTVSGIVNRFPEASSMLNWSNGAELDINASPLRFPTQSHTYSWSQMNHGTYGTFPRRPTQDDHVYHSLSAPPGASRGCVSNTANTSTTALLDMGSHRRSAYSNPYQPALRNASHNYGSADQRLVNSPNGGPVVFKAHEAGDSDHVGCIHLMPTPANKMPPPRNPYVDHHTRFGSFSNQWVERPVAYNSGRPYGTPSTYKQRTGEAFANKLAYSVTRQTTKGLDAAGYLWEIREQDLMKRTHNTDLPLYFRKAVRSNSLQFQHTASLDGLRPHVASEIYHFGPRATNDTYTPHYGYDARRPIHRIEPRDTQASTTPRLLTPSRTLTPSTLSECSSTPKAATEPSTFEATPEPPPGFVDLPLEVDKMINSYKLGMPVIIIASREVLDHVGLKLPQEFGYAVLGCFQICSQQMLRDTTEPEYEAFEWQFSIRWMQGSEGQFFREGIEPELMSSPWWSDTKETKVSSDCPDVLPLDLLSDNCVSAVGWYCHSCGKINQQVLFRHSKCSSSFCKGKPSRVRPTVTLEQLVTNQQDKLGMANPLYLKAPSSGKAYNIEWGDGMRTFKYHLGDGPIEEQALCSHVFNGSSTEFQDEATDLFYDMQTEVELVLDGVFFQCTMAPSDWESVSPSVKNAREWMLHMSHTYSDLPNPETMIEITSLSILAWWREGSSRKTLQPFLAKAHPIVVACLGQAITFTLKRVAHTTGKEAVKSPAKRTGKAQKQPTTLLTLNGGEADLNTLSKDKEPLQHDVVISMVHGDVLVLGGDDYEYQLKRHGAGIILIGTQ